MVSGVTLLGSITLNKTVGGLNPHAVRMAGELGARILWFPTHHAAHHNSSLMQGTSGDGEGIRLLNENGALLPEVEAILDLVAHYDMLLCTGHVSFPEALAVVQAGKAHGINRIIATHPMAKIGSRYTVAEAERLADLGAAVEFTFISMMPFRSSDNPQETVDAMRKIGPERCITSTDFGSYATPPPPEGMRMFIATLLHWGMTPEEVDRMARGNPTCLGCKAEQQQWTWQRPRSPAHSQ